MQYAPPEGMTSPASPGFKTPCGVSGSGQRATRRSNSRQATEVELEVLKSIIACKRPLPKEATEAFLYFLQAEGWIDVCRGGGAEHIVITTMGRVAAAGRSC